VTFLRAQTRSLLLLVPLALALALASCGGDDDSGGATSSPSTAANAGAGGGQTVQIDNFKFNPATIKVDTGARVTVSNKDSTAHTATADGGSFDTKNIDPGGSKTISLTKAGRFAYHCEIHPFMHGVIIVGSGAGS
jgi:plastocyanin